MPAKQYLKYLNGGTQTQSATQVSAGVPNAGDIVALDENGKLDNSLMPTGIGAETKLVMASENLADGDFVNIWDNAGTLNVRKADATTAGKEANGFVLAAVTSGQDATVYTQGINNHRSGLTGGPAMYLATTAGGVTATPPSSTGNLVQRVGTRLSATEVVFSPETIVILA